MAYDRDKPAVLVMTYTSVRVIKTQIPAGAGYVSRAIEDAVRCLNGAWDADPETIRFRIEQG